MQSLFFAFFFIMATSAWSTPLASRHAIVIDEESGNILFEKNATDIVPIASITKLMTAMVILDANLDMHESIVVTEADIDTLKFTSSRIPVGSRLSRHTLLELALMSSDNRAAHALARTYPGGMTYFRMAMRNKALALNLRRTNIEEPTGLSPHNTSTASDLARLTIAAAYYPDIERMSTTTADLVNIQGTAQHYRNTNQLINDPGWSILLSKTGFTREAGRCIVMRVHVAGRAAVMVLLNAKETSARTADAHALHRMLTTTPSTRVMATLKMH